MIVKIVRKRGKGGEDCLKINDLTRLHSDGCGRWLGQRIRNTNT